MVPYQEILVPLIIMVGAIVMFWLFRYAVARTQFYMALSYTIWLHMGASGHSNETLQELKERALTVRESRGGILESMITMFEAYLFIAQCYKRKEITDKNDHGKTKEVEEMLEYKTEIEKLKRYFQFEGFNDKLLCELMMYRPFQGNIYYIFDKVSLLETAYHRQIRTYQNSGKEEERSLGSLISH